MASGGLQGKKPFSDAIFCQFLSPPLRNYSRLLPPHFFCGCYNNGQRRKKATNCFSLAHIHLERESHFVYALHSKNVMTTPRPKTRESNPFQKESLFSWLATLDTNANLRG